MQERSPALDPWAILLDAFGMGDAEQAVAVTTTEQRAAMRHPMRHRITLALRELMTVSALARELGTNKGNIAHHVSVLERVGLVERAGSITGRGGTGVLYRSAPLRLSGKDATAGMLQTVTQAVLADAFALLRSVRLTPAQARSIAEHLEHLVLDLPTQPNAPRHGIFITLFEQ